MAEYRINSQNDTIDLILLALKELSLGIGIASICNIEVEKDEYSSTIVFKTKEDKEIKQRDFFWLGYFIGRDFEECNKCKNRKIKAIQKWNSIRNEKKIRTDGKKK